jgi:uncharacterized protein (DUF488 family)
MRSQRPDSSTAPRRIYTIGHSTRSFDDFAALLESHAVRQIADIRTIPRSRRHPQFGRDALERALPGRGIAYRHFPGLGGLRHPRRDSPNSGWRNDSFRGYADYMGTSEFENAVDELLAFAAAAPTAVMCAEAVWWRCHRGLLADALVARGIDVLHILSAAPAAPHQLNPMARVDGGRVTYPSLL